MVRMQAVEDKVAATKVESAAVSEEVKDGIRTELVSSKMIASGYLHYFVFR